MAGRPPLLDFVGTREVASEVGWREVPSSPSPRPQGRDVYRLCSRSQSHSTGPSLSGLSLRLRLVSYKRWDRESFDGIYCRLFPFLPSESHYLTRPS